MGTKPLFEAVDLGISSNCEKCKAFKKCKNPFMETSGDGDLGILIISDSPSGSDDISGSPFSGETGKYFEKTLDMLGYDLHTCFYIDHAVACKTTKEPTVTQINCCRERLFERIKELKPKAIISLGSIVNKALFGKFLKNTGVATLDGEMIPYKDLNCWVFPLYHPRYAMKNKWDTCISSQFSRSLQQALKKCRKPPKFPKFNAEKKIHMLTDFDEIVSFLSKLEKYEKSIAFDYETTGLNPYKPKHKTTTVSLTKSNMHTYCFPIEHSESGFDKYQVKIIKKLFKKNFLRNKSIFKIAHNSLYEMGWSRSVLNKKTKINWCTMTTQHIINAQPGSTGLKHQAFVRWGLHSYESDSKKWIDSGDSDYNRMFYMPLMEQLLYVGYDSYLTMKLYNEQKKEVPKWPQKFFNQGLISFQELTHNGMNVDIPHYDKASKGVAKQVKKIEQRIRNSAEVRKHIKRTKEEFNIDSSSQIADLLYNTMEIEVKNTTASGRPAADEKALADINHWIVNDILERRKLVKIVGTYVSQMYQYECNGKIHSTFALHIPRSFRSSSFNLNFQNLPKREAVAKEIVRKGLIPSKGFKLAEIDFSGCEVCTSACYHQDPNFIKYLQDPHSDMHRDNGLDLFMLTEEEMTKEIRFFVKNGWTFPQFYGDYYGSCAPNLMKNVFGLKLNNSEITVKEHLKSKGITTYKKFEDHCKKCEDIMWNERFKVYSKWKEDLRKQYEKTGKIITKLGFVFKGMLDKKQVTNYIIQSSAFHILLWCLNKCIRISKKEKWKTKFIGQVHDSMVLDLHPDEQDHVLKTIKRVCEVDALKKFKWINVPYGIDIDVSEVDGNFAEMKELKI